MLMHECLSNHCIYTYSELPIKCISQQRVKFMTSFSCVINVIQGKSKKVYTFNEP